MRKLTIILGFVFVIGMMLQVRPAAAQTTASPAQAPQKTASGKSAGAVPIFVPMPKDIQCELHGVSYRSVVGANGQLNNTSGSVDGITCWVSGKSPEQKKDVPLVSTEITDGILQTKGFGNFKLSPTNNINSTASGIAIRSDKVQALRTFLAKASAPTGPDAYVPIAANCIVHHAGYKGTIVAPGVSEPTGTVARLECNGKDIEIADNKMVDGIILTKTYGKVKVHFGSMVATVGAGDFTSVAEGKTAPEQVRDISVQKSSAESFRAQISQKDKPTAAQTTASGTTAKPPAAGAAAQTAPALKDEKAKTSYALGMNIGHTIKGQSVDLDQAAFIQGMKDVLAGGKTLMSDDEMAAALTVLQTEMTAKAAEKAKQLGEANKVEGAAFLAANKTKPGVVTLPSGLQYKIITAGTGPKPTAADTVVCNYRGTLINGKEFDSSYKRGQPASFPVGRVIKGWTEALQLMPVGSKWQLFIPPDLAYSDHGAGPDIGPNATLIFEVELISIQGK